MCQCFGYVFILDLQCWRVCMCCCRMCTPGGAQSAAWFRVYLPDAPRMYALIVGCTRDGLLPATMCALTTYGCFFHKTYCDWSVVLYPAICAATLAAAMARCSLIHLSCPSPMLLRNSRKEDKVGCWKQKRLLV